MPELLCCATLIKHYKSKNTLVHFLNLWYYNFITHTREKGTVSNFKGSIKNKSYCAEKSKKEPLVPAGPFYIRDDPQMIRNGKGADQIS